MDHRLELTILAEGNKAVVLARRGADVAVGRVQLGRSLGELKVFRDRLVAQLRGNAPQKLTRNEIVDFGLSLFKLFVVGDIQELYARLTVNDQVSWKILSDHPGINEIPWEFLQEPKSIGPLCTRSVVRILRSIGLDPPPPLPLSGVTRALLVTAEPDGMRNVPWSAIEQRWRSEYAARKVSLQLDVLAPATLESLGQAVAANSYDVVHFSCHGDASGSEGKLILVDRKTNAADPVEAEKIGRTLAGRKIRLVVLSACESSLDGTSHTSFSNTAEALIRLGIPAVVANQAPIKVPSAAVFVGALYGELLRSGNIDKAMAEARLRLSNDMRDQPEWGIPTLHRLYGGSQLYQ